MSDQTIGSLRLYNYNHLNISIAIVAASDAIEIQNDGVNGALPLAVVCRLRTSLGET